MGPLYAPLFKFSITLYSEHHNEKMFLATLRRPIHLWRSNNTVYAKNGTVDRWAMKNETIFNNTKEYNKNATNTNKGY